MPQYSGIAMLWDKRVKNQSGFDADSKDSASKSLLNVQGLDAHNAWLL
ncbi:hypothetical protein VCR20J5_790007 [Vibrio crassostreae]|nr:hypothetical protein VCR20J5_790007 [Vibrio crassostreae]